MAKNENKHIINLELTFGHIWPRESKTSAILQIWNVKIDHYANDCYFLLAILSTL